jgi:hypothetical protein
VEDRHSLIKAKMRETERELAGEMSGHFFFKERWYGFDDGIYAAARLLEILPVQPRSPSRTLKALPDGVSTPEIKVDAPDGDPHSFVERFRSTPSSRARACRPSMACAWTCRWLGPGARIEHHADPGDALRRRQRGGAPAHPGCVPRAAAGAEAGSGIAVLIPAGDPRSLASAQKKPVNRPAFFVVAGRGQAPPSPGPAAALGPLSSR